MSHHEAEAMKVLNTMAKVAQRKQFLFDLFVTAIEGGIDYWADVFEYKWSKAENGKKVEDVEGFRAVVRAQDFDNKKHVVNAEVIEKGLVALAEGKVTVGGQPMNAKLQAKWAALNAVNGEELDFDAGDADLVVQAALFNDVVFG